MDLHTILLLFIIVQLLSRIRLFVTPWTAACQAPCPSLAPRVYSNSCPLIELVMPSNHLIVCRTHLLLPSTFSSIRAFSSESALCIRWPKCWSFSISPSNEYSGLISFRLDWFDLAVQGTVRSLLFSNTTVQKHQIFSPQPSLWSSSQHLYMTIGKNMITLTRWTFTSKVMSLLF